jgi:hypothetical protein
MIDYKELMEQLESTPDFLSMLIFYVEEKKDKTLDLRHIALTFYAMGYSACLNYQAQKEKTKHLCGFKYRENQND